MIFFDKGSQHIVKFIDVRPSRWNDEGHMDKYMGELVTIKDRTPTGAIKIVEDGGVWVWREDDFEETLDFEIEEMFDL